MNLKRGFKPFQAFYSYEKRRRRSHETQNGNAKFKPSQRVLKQSFLFFHSYGNSNLAKYMERHKVRSDGKAFQLVSFTWSYSLSLYIFLLLQPPPSLDHVNSHWCSFIKISGVEFSSLVFGWSSLFIVIIGYVSLYG